MVYYFVINIQYYLYEHLIYNLNLINMIQYQYNNNIQQFY